MKAGAYATTIAKEVRALLPVWVVSGLVLVADAVFGPVRVIPLGLLAYGVGAVALGALSIGHEYTHRTLGILLAQPSSRRRILLIKQSVLAAMLLSLFALAEAVVLEGGHESQPTLDEFVLIVMPTLCGLFVAPWLTMIGRNPLHGAVFSVAIPGSLLVAGELIGAALFGAGSTEGDLFRLAFWSRTMLALCAVAAVLGWRKFLRLEVIDAAHREIAMPRWLRGEERAQTRHPLWMLAKKELHLQQLSFVVAAIAAAGWAAVVIGKDWHAGSRGVLFPPITALYVGLMAILIGSMASAEERQLGTHEWHLLLPVPRWQQWVVKVGVAFGAAAVLGVGLGIALPTALLSHYHTAEDLLIPRWWYILPVVTVLTASSLYVSSVCGSGIRAIVLSFPVGVAALLFVQWVGSRLMSVIVQRPSMQGGLSFLPVAARTFVTWSLEAAFIALLLWFGFLNHRSAERSGARVALQVAWLAGFVTFGIAWAFLT